MAGAQPLEQLLGAAEGAPHRQALGDEGGQRGQDAQRGELRGAREMQGAQGRAVVVETRLGDLHQGVEMRRGLVGEFVPDGGGDDAARRTEEQGRPSCRSRVRIWPVTAGWERPSSPAARVKDPAR